MLNYKKSSIFDESVSLLTSQERMEMLRNITSEADYVDYKEDISLDPEEDIISPVTTESQLNELKSSLTFFERMILFVYTHIFRENFNKSLESILIKKIRLQLLKSHSQYVNFQSKMFLSPFKFVIQNINIAVDVFRKPLLDALGEHRKEFYALLGAENLNTIHEKIINETDAEKLLNNQPDLDHTVLKTMIMLNCDNILGSIPKETKNKIANQIQILINIERLASFNFNKFLGVFSRNNTCPFELLTKLLEKLNNIIFSFTAVPSKQLLHTLFFFSYNVQRINKDDLYEKLKTDLQTAATAILLISELKKIPMTNILRVVKENYFYNPTLLTGGEDWFILYKKFWKSKIELAYRRFISQNKLEGSYEEIQLLLKIDEHPNLHNYDDKNYLEHSKFLISTPKCFEILYHFYKYLYPKLLSSVLLPIIENATFHREKEKIKIIQSINVLKQTCIDIQNFYDSLNPKNEVDKDEISKNEVSNENPAQEYSQPIKDFTPALSSTSRIATLLIQNSLENLRTIATDLKTIYDNGETKVYSPVSNLSNLYLNINNFEKSLTYYSQLLVQFVKNITDIRVLEERIFHMDVNPQANSNIATDSQEVLLNVQNILSDDFDINL